MTTSLTILCFTAISIGFFHTILGPDHYLPFILLSKARKWSIQKTMWITAICGLGHVLSSVILGLIGVLLGIGLNRLEFIESFRGNIAAWILIAFGLVYFIVSLKVLFRNKKHTHIHLHDDGSKHSHTHTHHQSHSHFHQKDVLKTTPWILFLIFVFGPCEPLIPILMYPAAQSNIFGVMLVASLFSIVTITTMLSVVLASRVSLQLINLKPLERYHHSIAGATIMMSGLAIQFLGL